MFSKYYHTFLILNLLDICYIFKLTVNYFMLNCINIIKGKTTDKLQNVLFNLVILKYSFVFEKA